MKKVILPTITVAVLILTLASLATADVPQMINYQGQLTDDQGDPVTAAVTMVFTIYDDSTAGVALWTEAHPSVTVTGGLFSVLLGSLVPIDDAVFNQPDRWLGITVGSDPELDPRTRFVSISYSHRVSTVDGATGGIISGDVDIQSHLSVSGKATIGPGHTNSGSYAFIAGNGNSANTAASYAAISGGRNNSCSGGELSLIHI